MRSNGNAEILERGYRRFEGERKGVFHAVGSTAWYTTKSIFGLGRKARQKFFPVTIIVLAFLIAVIQLAVVFLFDEIPDFLMIEDWEIVAQTWIFVLLFGALVAPEAIVRDRRDGLFSLYMSTPLTRGTYLAAKIFAVTGSMLVIVLGPSLLYFIGRTIKGVGPDGFGNWIITLGRILLACFAVALLIGLLSLTASCFTDRRAFASVIVILILIIFPAVTEALLSNTGVGINIKLLDPVLIGLEFGTRVFGSQSEDAISRVDTYLIYLSFIGWVGLTAGILSSRYRRLAAI